MLYRTSLYFAGLVEWLGYPVSSKAGAYESVSVQEWQCSHPNSSPPLVAGSAGLPIYIHSPRGMK